MKIIALIVAAGEGRRIGYRISKPYLFLGKRPILAHTLAIFQKCRLITKIVIVVNGEDKKRCEREVIKKNNFDKVSRLVIGGARRSDSVYNGLKMISGDCDIVVIHDGVRPFVTETIIKRSIGGAKKYKACVVGMPVTETIKIKGENNFVEETLERKKLWNIQTPQSFAYEVLLPAYSKYAKQREVTDDASLVEKMGYRVKLVEGSYENIKITTPEDLIFAEVILKGRNENRNRV